MSYYKTLKEAFTNTAFKNKAPTIPNAVETAYADMSRHQYGHREEIKNHCVKWLLEEVFTDDLVIEDFPTWHKEVCIGLAEKMNEAKKGFGTVGRAQKVINMAIKYLSCISDQYDDILKDCHMTLDGYTLAWYTSCVATEKREIKWSKIKSYDEYIAIQDNIRDYLSRGNTFSVEIDSKKSPEIPLPAFPFEAEFIIWEGKIAEIKYNSLINTLKNYKDTGRQKDSWIVGSTFDDYLQNF